MPNTNYPFDLGKFHVYIVGLYNSGNIEAWWHYLPGGMYFIASELSVNQIYNLLILHMPNRHLIVTEINPNNQQGWLAKEAWDWFTPYK